MEVNIELAKRLLEEQYFINGDNKIRTQHPIRVEDLAFIMQKYTDEQLLINGVVKSLPTDEEIYSEGCKYVRKIEQPNRQPLITLRRTFKAGAEFVKKQLDN